ncbi:hypothetical protein BPLS_P4043 [Bathymodiolus platifrons methanotrophic gill symbiont]|uniref:hypothetical protein n=1 Tax=Bathymodiolus platifrons methanotrophic gill symbiont TaxID=113268 RepID=UPI000B415033|nr:hypothetical protein [Bathymodiolus platifrons methanotrophic gill symbiont]GFO76329.1 hypothetical protein BPLS_P4043 [Bathymodiolus platifrons methanotrophic gill symbiont]
MHYLRTVLIVMVSISAITVVYKNIRFPETSAVELPIPPLSVQHKTTLSKFKITPLEELHTPDIVFSPEPMTQPPQQQVILNHEVSLITATSLDISTQMIGIEPVEYSPLNTQGSLPDLELKGQLGVEPLNIPEQEISSIENPNQLTKKHIKKIEHWQTQRQLRKEWHQKQLSQHPKRQALLKLRERLNSPQ